MLGAVASASGTVTSVGLSRGRAPNIRGLDRSNSMPLNRNDGGIAISKAAKVVRLELTPSTTEPFPARVAHKLILESRVGVEGKQCFSLFIAPALDL
jgi:hypothetical protein